MLKILSPHKNPFLFSAAISAVHLQWPWQDKYFTFTLSRPFRDSFFLIPSPFLTLTFRPTPPKVELSNALQKCAKDADSEIKHKSVGVGKVHIYKRTSSGEGPAEGPRKGCTKLKLN